MFITLPRTTETRDTQTVQMEAAVSYKMSVCLSINTVSYTYDYSHLDRDVPVQVPHYVTNKQLVCFAPQFVRVEPYHKGMLNNPISSTVFLIPLETWTRPEVFRRLRLPYFKIIGI